MSYPTYPNTYKKQIQVGEKQITIEVGKFSEQVSAAVLVTCGETVVHSTVALGRPANLDYFPLSVEFVEKLYASGIIKGSRWVKRDGRPSDDVILKARVIDRSLRPMFPDGLTNEVQIINTVLSYDGENDPDMLGLLGSALGLSISEIPFDGPLSGLRISYHKQTDKYVVNPTNQEKENADLDIIISGTGETVVMVEAGANEVSEKVVVEAMLLAQKELGQVCQNITEIVKEIGKEKVELISQEAKDKTESISKLSQKIQSKFAKEIREMVVKQALLQPSGEAELVEIILAKLNEGKSADADDLVSSGDVKSALHLLAKDDARKMILDENIRPDGRKTDEIRPIWCEVDVFPRTHGSAMFKRGATQAVTVTTLGTPSLGQLIEGLDGEEIRRYMHHYNMPPYASGEAGRFGYPKRREIGHGALAERALIAMLPSQEEFPYAIHVVSEIMSSNGSTSQASVCGSTMSLMAAGVPIKRPVAGIAMGLMSDGKKFVVLSDIQGLEDHVGDMDFKVAGTSEGITAIQMDIKLKGIPREVLEKALDQAKVGRLHIMGEMLKAIDKPRDIISQFAPKIKQLTIPASKIGELIGPGGKMIKSIIESTGAQVDVDEDPEKGVGVVNISSTDQEKIDQAYNLISGMMREVKIGDEFEGKVTRVESYGAFVEYLPNKEGLVHVSQMSTEFVADASEKVKLGETVHVRISEIKEDGKIGLSMLTQEEADQSRQNGRSGGNGGGRPSGGSRFGGGRPPFRGGRRDGGRDGGNNRGFGQNRDRDNNRPEVFKSRLSD